MSQIRMAAMEALGPRRAVHLGGWRWGRGLELPYADKMRSTKKKILFICAYSMDFLWNPANPNQDLFLNEIVK